MYLILHMFFFLNKKIQKIQRSQRVAQISFELANLKFYIKKIDEIIYKTS